MANEEYSQADQDAEPATAPQSTALTLEELTSVRELALAAHPDVVPELVGGANMAEILASVEPARAAFARIVATRPPIPAPPSVPAGAAPRLAIDPDRLPATEQIRRGLLTK